MRTTTIGRAGVANVGFQRVAVVAAALAAVTGTAAARVAGSPVAFDSAADPTYNNLPDGTTGWLNLSNGGYGFGPWMKPGLPNPTEAAGMIGSSTTNGTGDLDNDGDINTPRNASGRAWGFAADAATNQNATGGDAGVTRMLNTPLAVGQTFKIDMDNGPVADPVLFGGIPHPGVVEWTLGGDADLFGVQATGDSSDYLYFPAGGKALHTGVPLTYEGIHCELTLLGPKFPASLPGWMLTITPLYPGAATTIITGTRQGEPINMLGFTDGAGGADPANAVYFNNIEVSDVPEPGAVCVLAGGATLFLRRRRLRDQRKRPCKCRRRPGECYGLS